VRGGGIALTGSRPAEIIANVVPPYRGRRCIRISAIFVRKLSAACEIKKGSLKNKGCVFTK